MVKEFIKFDVHVSEIINKLSKSVGLLYKTSQCLPGKVLVNVYCTLVYPSLLYCSIAWAEHMLLTQRFAITTADNCSQCYQAALHSQH